MSAENGWTDERIRRTLYNYRHQEQRGNRRYNRDKVSADRPGGENLLADRGAPPPFSDEPCEDETVERAARLAEANGQGDGRIVRVLYALRKEHGAAGFRDPALVHATVGMKGPAYRYHRRRISEFFSVFVYTHARNMATYSGRGNVTPPERKEEKICRPIAPAPGGLAWLDAALAASSPAS